MNEDERSSAEAGGCEVGADDASEEVRKRPERENGGEPGQRDAGR